MKSLTAARIGVAAVSLLVLGLVAAAKISGLSAFAWFLLAAAGLVGFGWLLRKLYQLFMWRVGRRLLFSYLLIGVVPVPMLVLMGFGFLQVVATVFLGHLYRDTLHDFETDLRQHARQALALHLTRDEPGISKSGEFLLTYYENGRRIGGSAVLPEKWPAWLSDEPAPADGRAASTRFLHSARYVELPDGRLSLAVGVAEGPVSVAAVYDGEVAAELRRRSAFWVGLYPSDNDGEASPEEEGNRSVSIGYRVSPNEDEAEKPARAIPSRANRGSREEVRAFLGTRPESGWLDQPRVYWLQVFGPLYSLRPGEEPLPGVGTELRATPRWVLKRITLDASSESAQLQLALLMAVTLLLMLLYAVAVLVAGLMIWGLSSAVNRLSRATETVQKGDFSVRIPVRRTDQLGALQRSFNTMSENLEALVKTAAQKEILENEVAIARELQQSLIPQDLPRGGGLELATLFAPSAALGGDYFDILGLDGKRLAIVIADVSGHGLSAGLRMAMIKAALLVLMDEQHAPEVILDRLDALVRKRTGERYFVTATLALLDRQSGRLELFNAGHPPTYLLRGGEVEEICLPGSPLGALGHHYGKTTRQLEPGDILVWLSDGFLEATNSRDEALGYDGVARALTGPWTSAVAVRSHLLATLERHAAGRAPEDDRSLVVMRYQPE